MSHNCDEATRQLYQYLDAELDTAIAEEIRAHLEACHNCFGSFEFERRLKLVIRNQLGEDMPATLMARVKDLIHQEQTRPVR